MRGLFGRLIGRLGGQAWFATVMRRVAPGLDRAVHRLTGGRVQLSGAVLPTLILRHRGRRSGRRYETPLAFLPDGERYVLIGSNWGQAHHPAWTYNLLADPDVVIETRGRRVAVTARLATDEERPALWRGLTAMWPAYDTYVERAGGREIRLFVLEPRAQTTRPPAGAPVSRS